jgi:hypothetical protein
MSQQDEFVGSRKGQDILGVDESRFHYYVRRGLIGKKPGKTAVRGALYNVADILQVKQEISKQYQKKQPHALKNPLDPVVLDWIYPQDIPACLALDYRLYQEAIIADARTYQAWVGKNNQIALAAYDARERSTCLAYISILPLEERTILAILRGDRDEGSVLAEEIRTYDDMGAYTLLVNSAAADVSRPDLIGRLLSHVMEIWVDRFPERYITKIYAQVVSPQGDRMAQHFFMSPLYDLAQNAHVLDLARPGVNRIIRRFQQALAEKSQP